MGLKIIIIVVLLCREIFNLASQGFYRNFVKNKEMRTLGNESGSTNEWPFSSRGENDEDAVKFSSILTLF